ncbi:MAG TPA: hypothetical protein ENJ82_00980 [Bacteroidetes bacterium]|nr:hypothetical protein [Bacteroidota bacterium]
MNSKILFGAFLAFTFTAFFMVMSFSGPERVEAGTQVPVAWVADMACPNSPATIQGCILDVQGCTYVNTINGRLIAVNLSAVTVGAGDIASITGNFVADADCAPCVLNATSATDLGDC